MQIERDGDDIKITETDGRGEFGVYLSLDDIEQINKFLETPEYTPGVYRDEDGDLWVLTPGGDWLQEIGNQGLQVSGDSAPPYEYYTLTPITPRSF